MKLVLQIALGIIAVPVVLIALLGGLVGFLMLFKYLLFIVPMVLAGIILQRYMFKPIPVDVEPGPGAYLAARAAHEEHWRKKR